MFAFKSILAIAASLSGLTGIIVVATKSFRNRIEQQHDNFYYFLVNVKSKINGLKEINQNPKDYYCSFENKDLRDDDCVIFKKNNSQDNENLNHYINLTQIEENQKDALAEIEDIGINKKLIIKIKKDKYVESKKSGLIFINNKKQEKIITLEPFFNIQKKKEGFTTDLIIVQKINQPEGEEFDINDETKYECQIESVNHLIPCEIYKFPENAVTNENQSKDFEINKITKIANKEELKANSKYFIKISESELTEKQWKYQAPYINVFSKLKEKNKKLHFKYVASAVGKIDEKINFSLIIKPEENKYILASQWTDPKPFSKSSNTMVIENKSSPEDPKINYQCEYIFSDGTKLLDKSCEIFIIENNVNTKNKFVLISAVKQKQILWKIHVKNPDARKYDLKTIKSINIIDKSDKNKRFGSLFPAINGAISQNNNLIRNLKTLNSIW